MILTDTQTAGIKNQVAAAFGNRRTVRLDTAGEIGQSNFYGDDSMPAVNRTQVFQLIECAICNWSQPDHQSTEEWIADITTQIINDIR